MKKLVVLLLCAAILAGGVVVFAAGGSDDPFVSLSYLTQTFLPSLNTQIQSKVEEKTDAVYQPALDELTQTHNSYLNGSGTSTAPGGNADWTYASALTDLRLKKGDTITLPTGSGVMLLAGRSAVTFSGGVVVDVTQGQTLLTGSSLTQRHHCLAGENTTAAVSVLSDTAVISVEGYYSITPGNGVDYNALAGALRELGLFQGDGTAYGEGYNLETAPTRIVGLVMFLRLLGEEQAALSSTVENPFSDTPDWCDRYVAYAYAKGYTEGIGPDGKGGLLFGPGTAISADQYVTFLLRALGYSDQGDAPDFLWSEAVERACELGVLTAGEASMLQQEEFLRAQVVYLSYFALSAPLKDGSGVLLDRTAASSGIAKETFLTVMNGVSVPRL